MCEKATLERDIAECETRIAAAVGGVFTRLQNLYKKRAALPRGEGSEPVGDDVETVLATTNLPCPQSQGLVEAAELEDVNLYTFRADPHVVVHFKSAEVARRYGEQLKALLPSRASDRSA